MASLPAIPSSSLPLVSPPQNAEALIVNRLTIRSSSRRTPPSSVSSCFETTHHSLPHVIPLHPSSSASSSSSSSPSSFRLEVFSFSGVTDNDAQKGGGIPGANPNPDNPNPNSSSVYAMAKRGYGAFGGGATLEKSKLDLSQSTSRVSPKTEDGGGGGGIGNKINFGGGDGGDDGGDDDDYFGDADDDDEEGDDGGFFGRRIALPEIFDREVLEAVLQEWYRTVTDLPAGLRQAVELGFISSAQMVRFISNFGRPTIARIFSRAVPPSVSRVFIGRMIADPAFMYKMGWEQVVTVSYGIWSEFKNRKERLKDEWAFAALNVLSMSVCNAAIVWSLAPCRSYGSTFKFNLQNTIQKLPNNIFERSYAFREFDAIKRAQSFFYKAGELCLVGLITGAASGSLMKLLASRKESSSISMPTVKASALSYGAFLGISENFRYQLLYGMERVMQQQFNHVGTVVFLCTALRALNVYIGDAARMAWIGLGVTVPQGEGVQAPYQRSTATVSASSTTKSDGQFDIRDKIPFGLFSSGKESSRPRQTRRKVKKRVVLAT